MSPMPCLGFESVMTSKRRTRRGWACAHSDESQAREGTRKFWNSFPGQKLVSFLRPKTGHTIQRKCEKREANQRARSLVLFQTEVYTYI